MTYLVPSYFVLVLIVSTVTFAAYGFDKFRAKRNGRRLPEKTLHVLSLIGGWPGAFLAQRFFRHKTQKTSFQIVFWACGLVNLLVLAGGLYVAWAT